MKHLYLLFIILILFSCNKYEEVNEYETIYPLPYLPAFPGSYWKYLDENGDTVVINTDPEYKLHSYESFELYSTKTVPVYVPYWNGEPLYGYSSPQQNLYIGDDEHWRGLKQIGYLS